VIAAYDDGDQPKQVVVCQPPITVIIAGSERLHASYLLSADAGGVGLQDRRRHHAMSCGPRTGFAEMLNQETGDVRFCQVLVIGDVRFCQVLVTANAPVSAILRSSFQTHMGSLHESALSVRHLGRSMNGLRAGMSAPPLMAAARVAAGVTSLTCQEPTFTGPLPNRRSRP
jgi:hypothetical protein